MTAPNLPVATPERVQNADVGDQFIVEADPSEDEAANDHHVIELKDPPGRHGHVFNCRRCDAWYYSTHNFELNPCVPHPRYDPPDEFLIDDTEKDRTRTLVMDIPMPDLLHALFRSEAYCWHTRYNIDVDVMLATDSGPKSVKIVPHDGDTSPRTLDDYFSDGTEDDPAPQNKSAATFVIYDDADLVTEAADELLRIARDAPVYSQPTR